MSGRTPDTTAKAHFSSPVFQDWTGSTDFAREGCEAVSSRGGAAAGRPRDPAASQRLLSGFSHGCRNALNGLKISLYLFRREAGGRVPPCWDELDRHYLRIERVFDRLQAIYRPMALTMVRSPLGALLEDRASHWRGWFERRGRTLRMAPPSTDPPGDFDPIRLGAGLDALAEWRAEGWETAERTHVSWRMDADHFEIQWEEHGPRSGTAPETASAAGPGQASWFGPGMGAFLEPCAGARVHAASESGNGPEAGGPGEEKLDPESSLALPLLARTIGAHGGSLKTAREPSFRLAVRWPRFFEATGAERPPTST